MAALAASAASGDSKAIMSRITAGGRKLTYQLTVIQQPERARACGAGAKASADRRPVDPPPVVELRIFEGEGEAMADITYSYNVNFILFATLEAARPIAQGRVQNTSSTIPVLTGVPVSGMAYLDRPTPAGYFIFPDLSVRNEGKYILSFNLYEEVKDEAADGNAEPAHNHPLHASNKHTARPTLAPTQFLSWRLDVRSQPFTVFSAKKFPGLAESTALSRIVAEQGCRVRIRRDVRMRRRDKNGKDFDDFDAGDATYATLRATPTPPDVYPQTQQPAPIDMPQQQQQQPIAIDTGDRHRSSSNASLDPPTYSVDAAPHTAYPPAPHFQQMQPAAPMPAPAYNNNYAHLQFGGSAFAPQYAMHAPAPMIHPPQTLPANAPAYSPHLRHNSSGGNLRYAAERQPIAPAPYPSSEGKTGADARRPSNPQSAAHTPQYTASAAAFDHHLARAYHQYSNAPPVPVERTPTPGVVSSQALPPLKSISVDESFNALASPANTPPRPAYDAGQAKPAAAAFAYPSAPPPAPETTTRPGKRRFDAVFSDDALKAPLQNGLRPSLENHGADAVTLDDEYGDGHEHKVSYKRADGRECVRRLPA